MNVIVIGGGVSGYTTGLLLELAGYNTCIYTKEQSKSLLGQSKRPARVATAHAAASVIPHSVELDNERKILENSMAFFETMAESGRMGVRPQQHFILKETQTPPPFYYDIVKDFSPIDPPVQRLPRRSEADQLHGWQFRTFFVEMPYYIPELARLYRKSGGSIKNKTVKPDDIEDLPASIIVNTAGLYGEQFRSSEVTCTPIRGHLLYVDPAVINSRFSYNYYTAPGVYHDNQPTSVYSYPRFDALVLGGTRQEGKIKDGSFVPVDNPDVQCEHMEINGIEVPRYLLELNQKLLEPWTRKPIKENHVLKASAGWRPYRKEGVELSRTTISGRTVIHNFGHGGAGVTLSFGCAVEVVKNVQAVTEPTDKKQPKNNLLNALFQKLMRV